LDEERETYLDFIMSSAVRINELINELIKCQQEKKSNVKSNV